MPQAHVTDPENHEMFNDLLSSYPLPRRVGGNSNVKTRPINVGVGTRRSPPPPRARGRSCSFLDLVEIGSFDNYGLL